MNIKTSAPLVKSPAEQLEAVLRQLETIEPKAEADRYAAFVAGAPKRRRWVVLGFCIWLIVNAMLMWLIESSPRLDEGWAMEALLGFMLVCFIAGGVLFNACAWLFFPLAEPPEHFPLTPAQLITLHSLVDKRPVLEQLTAKWARQGVITQRAFRLVEDAVRLQQEIDLLSSLSDTGVDA